jgi:hypothetical protein
MDLTAYYTAGKVLSSNMDIYKNHFNEDWHLWDGVAVFEHSRFLYPPIAASMFSLFANIDYEIFKYFWNFFTFLCVVTASFLFLRLYGLHRSLNNYLIAGVVLFNFFPFITLLERGQIDGFTFLIVACAVTLILKGSTRNRFAGGVLWAFASLFKFYCALVIPFLLLRKRFTEIWGYAAGAAAIFLLMLLVNGKDVTYNYFAYELPRISAYAESGTEEMKINSVALREYFQMTPDAISFADGKMYRTEVISFNSKASVMRVFIVAQQIVDINIPNIVVSCLMLLILIGMIWLVEREALFTSEQSFIYNLAFWQLIITMIMFVGVFTWVMNLVWLLPVMYIIMYLHYKGDRGKEYLLLMAGFILAAIPDAFLLLKDSIAGELLKAKYIISEVLIFAGLLLSLKKLKTINAIYTEYDRLLQRNP